MSTGSSPRVRGKQPVEPLGGQPRGLIPACAGKTKPARPRRLGPWAHPRVCGENEDKFGGKITGTGSSPRVRGKPHRPGLRPRRHRLIPACAGKTPRECQPPNGVTAHPRVCGENSGLLDWINTVDGSSPRVRGKPRGRRARSSRRGLIPACAGKTRSIARLRAPSAAHPRVCGENSWLPSETSTTLGSSPRVRGKRLSLVFPAEHSGLTPACAGKTP